jgi:hypothetical protein
MGPGIRDPGPNRFDWGYTQEKFEISVKTTTGTFKNKGDKTQTPVAFGLAFAINTCKEDGQSQ